MQLVREKEVSLNRWNFRAERHGQRDRLSPA